jgi:predicted metal-binding protein
MARDRFTAGLKSYRLKKAKGPILLACGKCQKRLKGEGDPEGIVPLKKVLKQVSKEQGSRSPYVIKVPCLKLCPKDGLVVLTARQVARRECSVLRTREDVGAISRALRQERTA